MKTMDLPLWSAIFVAFALTLYVLLDGFDLGVGTLLLLQPDERVRDVMLDSIVPTWDGNETWLIMAGVALLAAFPVAYGVLLPAFYLPLIAMLLALGLRGVSFEYRVEPRARRRRWDAVFAFGSVVATLAQGLVLGGLIQGVSVERGWFTGSPLDVFSPFGALTAATLLVGYSLLGAGWIHLKGESETREFARRQLKRLAPLFAGIAVATCLVAAHLQTGVSTAWARHGVVLGGVSAIFLLAAIRLAYAAGKERFLGDGEAFAIGLVMTACGVVGLGVAIFPDMVPFRVSLWDASSGTASHVFLLIGAVIVTPMVLAYSAFAYWVFRGKTPKDGWLS
jgi:cytochrome d ubiquinol oxidase subunit II